MKLKNNISIYNIINLLHYVEKKLFGTYYFISENIKILKDEF